MTAETLIQAIKCPSCEDIIFSRTRHDFHPCSCKTIFVDGGTDYTRYGFLEDTSSNLNELKIMPISVKASKEELYNDWNSGKDQFGLVRKVDR